MRKFFGIENLDPCTVAKNLVMIILGAAISAAGINAFLVPHKFLSGGVAGFSQLMSYITPLSVGTYVLVFNIPIFAFGWRYVGRSFIIGSIFGTAAFSGALYATAWMAHAGYAPERLLAAIVGGALSGAGTGLVFRVNSSHGGTDIIAAAVKRRWSVSIGTVVFAANAVIICVLATIYGLHAALYTIVSQFCSAVALDKVMLGWDRSRAVFIISSEPQKIADVILKKLNRGVTYLDGEGAYMRRKERVIYCVVSLSQLARVKYHVRKIDPNAFLTVAEVSEVLGKGFRAVPI